MKLKLLILIGATFFTPLLAAAADVNLYDMVESMTKKELLLTGSGRSIGTEWYVREYASSVLGTGALISSDDVTYALRKQYDELCKKTDKRPAQTYGDCLNVLIPSITKVLRNENRVRALGRDLTLITSGYEDPISGKQEDLADLPFHYRSLMRIWQAGTGTTVRAGTGLYLRTVALSDPDKKVQAKTKVLGDALRALMVQKPTATGALKEQGDEAFIAAVWYYQHGVRFVRGERPEFPPPPPADALSKKGTERQYLFLKQEAVENALKDLWSMLGTSSITPPLKRGEVALFSIPQAIQDTLPDNVRLWVYVEQTNAGVTSGDIGLEWNVAIDPVLPSLCDSKDGKPSMAKCTPILGGLYPPAPVDGTGLCTHPLQRKGYLCRPMDSERNPTLCDATRNPDANEIILTTCRTSTAAPRETIAGPDACMDANWTRSAIAFNPNTQCKISLSCDTSAGGYTGGVTSPKQADGTIKVSTKENPDGGSVYIFIHELTHARQQCELPPGTELYKGEKKLTSVPKGTLDAKEKEANDDICCMRESEAYRRQCEAMVEDGIFRPNTGTGELMSTLGFPLNVETCWQFLTDTSCKTRTDITTGRGCPNTFSYDKKFTPNDLKDRFIPELNKLVKEKSPANMAYSCTDALNPPAKKSVDPRITASLRDLDAAGKKVCDPNRTTTYDNTIGNNLCYIDQCLEQSMETHRLVPGRAPLTVGDSAYPYDSCEPQSPVKDTVQFTTIPAAIPPYRPGLLLKQIDTALCQSNGLPPLTPPILCSFDARRRLLLPLGDLFGMSLNLFDQSNAQESTALGIQSLSDALGARIASELFSGYLQGSARGLGDITYNAAELLKNFTKVKFSPEMCPRGNEGGWLLTNPACTPQSSSSSVAP